MSLERYKHLSKRHQALVALAVLFDGIEAGEYLAQDGVHGEALRNAALDLARLSPELRMPLVGTLLRMALAEL